MVMEMEEHLLPMIPLTEASPSATPTTVRNLQNSHVFLSPDANTPGDSNQSMIHKSRSAPSLFVAVSKAASLPCEVDSCILTAPPPGPSFMLGFLCLALCLMSGCVMYAADKGGFEIQRTTSVLVDGLYFSVETLFTIGYGDIAPRTDIAKLLVCTFILFGFGFVYVLLNGLLTHVLNRQEEAMLGMFRSEEHPAALQKYVLDVKKGRLRVRLKVGLAVGVVLGCIALGAVMARVLEGLGWVDSVYLAVTSVTTVGYGNVTFVTAWGRVFATVWLMVSTLAVARAFLYLTELRIEKRNREVSQWVLHKKMTSSDMKAADLDGDGTISKSEYVIYKLKEMGKIAEKDIVPICEQFDRLDKGNCGKITLSDLLESHH